MARSWFFPGRVTEASPEVLVNSGAASGFGTDPIDGDRGFVRLGQGRYDLPSWTIDRARRYSIAAYRSNPMARAIVDTYTAFVVGDSGVGYQCSNPEVRAVVDAWWTDPRNRIGEIQEQLFRDHFLLGETVVEHLVGDMTGVVRHSIIDPARVASVELRNGNPLWPGWLHFAGGDDIAPLEIVSVDDYTGLRTGRVSFFASNRALVTDRRGVPFLASIQDQLDAYDQVINNLVDRTALARYLVWDVTVDGGTGVTIDAHEASRVLLVQGFGTDVQLQHLSITGGHTRGDYDGGGGIRSFNLSPRRRSGGPPAGGAPRTRDGCISGFCDC